MSVYTIINQNELENFLTQYNLGNLKSFTGISAGIENTNYFVDTTKGSFVLTIFEHHTIDELDYFLQIMAFMADHKIPTATPQKTKNNKILTILKGKPAALVNKLAGSMVEQPTKIQVKVIGQQIAKFHLAGQEFDGYRANDRDLNWITNTFNLLKEHLPIDEIDLISDEIQYQQQVDWQQLPQGIIHADLFCDNALFDGNKISGIIDLYYACNSTLLYDLAVMVNDWCRIQTDGNDEMSFEFDTDKIVTMLGAYQQVRPLTSKEKQSWQAILRLASLRFLLSRLQYKHLPRTGEITQIKNPDVYKKILLIHRGG